jgi:predicted alpha/beta-hydrolase family hydrolase
LDRFVSSSVAKPISITVSDAVHVSGLLQNPPHARACYVLAHGTGAGMNHPFMAAVAAELARRDNATLRYQFPYMERGAKRPDPPRLRDSCAHSVSASYRQTSGVVSAHLSLPRKIAFPDSRDGS